ncbi:ABC transporter permease [Clostridium neuense]|uniref:Transport permease protein n=1 Tax=Clostridium neuense TaxID=1728934 RepID=A0ABW8TI31_9CLOT
MEHFFSLLNIGIRRRSKDFFILFYNIVFPAVIIMLLGYLTSKSYGTSFTSYHYYTIVMIPFCELMGVTSIAYAAQDERIHHTAYRYMAAPITRTELVLSKFFSCAIMLSICDIVVLAIAKLMFHIPFNGKVTFIILLFISETVIVTGIGLFLGLACKNFAAIQNFLNLPITIFGFLGGAFFPIGSTNSFISFIIDLSPLTWVNRGIVACIYENNTHILIITSIVFMLVGSIITMLAVKFFKREAFI